MKKIALFLSLAIVIVLVFVGWSLWNRVLIPTPLSPNPPPPTIMPTSPNLSPPTTPQSESEVYRNTDWKFEFQYPKKWIILEKSFGSRSSKFNVVASPDMGEYDPPPFLVNVVFPDFADNTFLGSNPTTSTVTVDGVVGIEYQYDFEEHQETAIVLPLGEYKVILGTREPYESKFNQIVSTFKFLK